MSNGFINVPNLPGVPTVNFSPFPNPLTITTLLTADLVSQFTAVFGPQWGIFLGGIPIIVAESVISFDYRQDYTIADYPVEMGIFESYDKVQVPFLVKVRFAQGGSTGDREAFLNQFKFIVPSLDIYDVVTPEIIYPSVTIQHIDYRRTNINGVGLISVDVWVQQIIVSAFTGFLPASQVQSTSAADPNQNGQLNGTPITGAAAGTSFPLTQNIITQSALVQ